MSRLPQPGSDNNQWGAILNDYLTVSLKPDGTLKDAIVGDAQVSTIAQSKVIGLSATLSSKATDTTVIHNITDENIAGIKTFTSSPIVPTPTSGTDAANKTYVDTAAAAGTPDATSLVKGKIQLAGDLGGTAALPTVPGLSTKEPTITAGTTSQYYRGDKTWQTLDKIAVGLGNVDNTSDVSKPVSTAMQTALNAKANLADIIAFSVAL